tara:strand:+ start:86 stop:412 length:327 start_codon:yes stop_codon:yes gene_type:complete
MKETKEISEDLWDGEFVYSYSINKIKKYAKEFRNELVSLNDIELINRFNNHCTVVGGVTISIYRKELIKELDRRFDISSIQERNKNGSLISTSFKSKIRLINKTIKTI